MDEPSRWGVMGSGGIAAAFTADLHLTKSGRVVAVGVTTSRIGGPFR